MRKDPSLKSKLINSARFLFASGILCFLGAFFSWHTWSQGIMSFNDVVIGPHAIFHLAYSWFGIKGLVGLFVLFGILFIMKARSLMRKSEQIKED